MKQILWKQIQSSIKLLALSVPNTSKLHTSSKTHSRLHLRAPSCDLTTSQACVDVLERFYEVLLFTRLLWILGLFSQEARGLLGSCRNGKQPLRSTTKILGFEFQPQFPVRQI